MSNKRDHSIELLIAGVIAGLITVAVASPEMRNDLNELLNSPIHIISLIIGSLIVTYRNEGDHFVDLEIDFIS